LHYTVVQGLPIHEIIGYGSARLSFLLLNFIKDPGSGSGLDGILIPHHRQYLLVGGKPKRKVL
jgi:hypothetical protein